MRRQRPRACPRPRPVAVVPPGDVAVAEAVRGCRAVAGEAVDEPEPVLMAPRAAVDSLDRLHEAAAVAGRHLRLRLERPEQGLPCGTSVSTMTSLPRSRVTQSRAWPSAAVGPAPPQPARASATRRGARQPTRRALGLTSRAFDRTAPTAKARTSPTCLPTQARPLARGLELPAVRLHLGTGGRRRLAGVIEGRDRVAVRGPGLERERRRPARGTEGRVVPQHLVAVLEHHLVGADRRRGTVHLEHPPRPSLHRDSGRSG